MCVCGVWVCEIVCVCMGVWWVRVIVVATSVESAFFGEIKLKDVVMDVKECVKVLFYI